MSSLAACAVSHAVPVLLFALPSCTKLWQSGSRKCVHEVGKRDRAKPGRSGMKAPCTKSQAHLTRQTSDTGSLKGALGRFVCLSVVMVAELAGPSVRDICACVDPLCRAFSEVSDSFPAALSSSTARHVGRAAQKQRLLANDSNALDARRRSSLQASTSYSETQGKSADASDLYRYVTWTYSPCCQCLST